MSLADRPTDIPANRLTRKVPRCPVCGAEDVQDLGAPRYRARTRVAGSDIDLSDLGQRHRRCPACTYRFVYPPIPPERLMACYRASSNNWETGPGVVARRLYDEKRAALERHARGRRVLDLGCYDGGFLGYLGPGWEKLGIEPSAVAADAARGRGIDIVAPTLDAVDWGRHAGTCDAVVCFDVLEHLGDPVPVLRGAARLLRPGGVMVVQTGDTDSWNWRLIGKAYWYCGLPEHVGFFNRRSLEAAAGRAGLEIVEYARTRHSRLPWYVVARWAFSIPGYWTLRALNAARIPLPAPLSNVAAGVAPGSLCQRDHCLAVLRLPA